ncbi:MarR family transcriptional regulator [Candidatus Cryosericum hinesii]|jgi:DNA-binding MarR family transcriptional regulator|uniref:MarR family transcriptional regulator n=1 Tax=Candidatus Cryosericum hinesii TaxID=2290915 RepID=A0A398DIV9_9BACT|nr:MarR family transcriptional regulator [Candidatus Cryosericum hinesii]RIE08918.1 MarR family transcriptional regulator [Candidatus Cryosericum hinesii]RIE12078.1 MarR family transcriptional regulator [Candidatus Cryosericum hinesii]RIE12740.1 MarR family transcriptional regulator [Candidatus Cryosericum hinesii]
MKNITNSKRMELVLLRLRSYWETEDPRRVGGLTASQLSLLLSLSEHPGCRVQDTAERLDLTAPTISIGVRRLENMGLVQRGADPDDQRAVCLYLSPQGRKIASKARSLRAAKLETMLSPLTVDEQESLLEMLEKVVPNTD